MSELLKLKSSSLFSFVDCKKSSRNFILANIPVGNYNGNTLSIIVCWKDAWKTRFAQSIYQEESVLYAIVCRQWKNFKCHCIKLLFYFSSINIWTWVIKIFKISRKFVRHLRILLSLFNALIVFLSLLEEADLQRTLQSLACGKIRLLNKKPLVMIWFNSILRTFLFVLDERHQSYWSIYIEHFLWT